MRQLQELQLSKDQCGSVLLPRGSVVGEVGLWRPGVVQSPELIPEASWECQPGVGRGHGSLPVQLSLFRHCSFCVK